MASLARLIHPARRALPRAISSARILSRPTASSNARQAVPSSKRYFSRTLSARAEEDKEPKEGEAGETIDTAPVESAEDTLVTEPIPDEGVDITIEETVVSEEVDSEGGIELTEETITTTIVTEAVPESEARAPILPAPESPERTAALAVLDALPVSEEKNVVIPSTAQRDLARNLIKYGAGNLEALSADMTRAELTEWISVVQMTTALPATEGQYARARYLLRRGAKMDKPLVEGMSRQEMSVWLTDAAKIASMGPRTGPRDPAQRADPATDRQLLRAKYISSLFEPGQPFAELPWAGTEARPTKGDISDYLDAATQALFDQGKRQLVMKPIPEERDDPVSPGMLRVARKYGLTVNPKMTKGEVSDMLEASSESFRKERHELRKTAEYRAARGKGAAKKEAQEA
ncbi:hypothetical protein CALCODRAFT_489855 [Calocera cornea HHB12733]|uniref:Uncharacterized protein n=1 Tax=Calocera cornea HHB12733 TaxID=1353952 RepID=A0A165JZW9_9BASI|nr:hypothetical protein CALCODRAFT_489855 [Calocera cornea HHB12733]